MKLFLVSFLVLCSLTSYANSPLPNSRHISITGNASKSVMPDSALIDLHVESFQVISLDAKSDVDKRVNYFLAGVGKFGIKEKDISASKIRTDAEYRYDQNNGRKLIGYRASRRLKVTLADLDELNALLDYALQTQINSIENIEFKSAQEEELKAQANALAIEDAKQRASALAEAFDAKLGKIYSINSSSNFHQDRYGMNESFDGVTVMGARLAKAREAGKYLQENIVFSASISVVFELQVD